MKIERVTIKNYRAINELDLELNAHMNIIVADNASGKSTILEAINLCLTSRLNEKLVEPNSINPFLLNRESVQTYLNALSTGQPQPPPEALIELYFKDEADLAEYKGTNNTLKKNVPGISFRIFFDENFSEEYSVYVKNKDILHPPTELYSIEWRNFADNEIKSSRHVAVKPMLIDTSDIKSQDGARKYIVELLSDHLDIKQKASLAMSYRGMKENFLQEESVIKLNGHLKDSKTEITEKSLSIALDSSARSTWEQNIEAKLNEIPLYFAGKGEQNSVKLKLALAVSDEKNILLIEEPENHLSYSNLNNLIAHIADKAADKQVIITTHSSFVMNKLGLNNLILLSASCKYVRFNMLEEDTKNYFLKLPGHDTLRLILAKKVILVEGPSDELIVQKAYLDKNKRLPIEDGIDVICVKSLAFKRFLEISKLTGVPTVVVTDNDGDLDKLKKKYEAYEKVTNIQIKYSTDISNKTLEPQIVASNTLEPLNKIFDKKFTTAKDLSDYMENNKTECALAIFSSKDLISFPGYINEAIT